MGICKKICVKIIKKFWPEKIPDFAASMYENLARNTKTSFYSTVASEIVEEINARRGNVKNLLDIGTGPGFMLFEIAKLRPDLTLVGVDLCDKLLKLADEEKFRQGCPHIFFMKCDANHLNFCEGECDFVISSGVLHSLKNPSAAIREWLRVLKPGGNLWIYDPTVLVDKESRDLCERTLDNMEKCLKNFKDRFLFRLLCWISDLPFKPIPLEYVYKIVQDAGIIESVAVKDRGSYLKIAIIKK